MSLTVIGVLEFNSIALGIKALDHIVKKAPVSLLDARTICPGKYLIVFTGDEASVEASLTAGKQAGEGFLIDELFIANLNEQIIPALTGTNESDVWEALGVLELFSATASIRAGDIAAKEADVFIPEIRLATGLGGKSFFKVLGKIEAVEAAMAASKKFMEKNGLVFMDIILPRPSEEIKPFIL